MAESRPNRCRGRRARHGLIPLGNLTPANVNSSNYRNVSDFLGLIDFYIFWLVLAFTGYTRLYLALLGITSFPGFYWVSRGFTRFQGISLGVLGFFSGFYWVVLGCTEFT